MIELVNRKDIMCWLIDCIHSGCIWSMTSDLLRHSVLDILQRYMRIFHYLATE